jgi:hypothetical protein
MPLAGPRSENYSGRGVTMNDRDTPFDDADEPDERIPTYPSFLKYWLMDLFPIWAPGLVLAGAIVWYSR